MSENKSANFESTEPVTEELQEAVRSKATDGAISCAALRILAEDSGVSYKLAGAAANKSGIKIRSCDLGCF